jgi:hypothetical protein
MPKAISPDIASAGSADGSREEPGKSGDDAGVGILTKQGAALRSRLTWWIADGIPTLQAAHAVPCLRSTAEVPANRERGPKNDLRFAALPI